LSTNVFPYDVYVSCVINFLLKRVEVQTSNSICGNIWWATKSHSNCVFISLNTVFDTSWPTCIYVSMSMVLVECVVTFILISVIGSILCTNLVYFCVHFKLLVCVRVRACTRVLRSHVRVCSFSYVRGIIYWTCDPKWFQSEKGPRCKYLNIEWYVHFVCGWYLSHSQVWSLFTYVIVFLSNKEHDKENTGCYRSCLTNTVKYLTMIIVTCVQFFILMQVTCIFYCY